jgi:hypothetical protein
MATERVTVTLPAEILQDIDRLETNRSRFVLAAVRHEIERRRREALRRSLGTPHPDSAELAEVGFDEWAGGLPVEDVTEIVDIRAGKSVRWILGEGWVEAPE